MKKLISSITLLFFAYALNAQTIPTTTVTGSLKINDSLSVSNNISAADVKANGEIISKDTMRAEKDVKVAGNVSIAGKLGVHGVTVLDDDLYAKTLNIGTFGNSAQINAVTNGAARIIYFWANL